MIKVYNPIYNSVFKYIMQNNRMAKFFLGTILDKQIISLEMKNNDYVVVLQNGMKVLRIDFAATIQEEGQTPEVVTIELQKAVAQGEIMRFRKYLGFHYQNEANCLYEKEEKNGMKYEKQTPYHIYAIYILGHTIGSGLKYAVLKDRHVFTDHLGQEVSIPKTNKFVSGLTHDTIIVQTPYVKKNSAKTQLERLLSIFDQDQAVERKYIELDEDCDHSPEYQELMKTLLKATADQQLKGELDLEEEMEKLFNDKERQINELQCAVESNQRQIAELDNQLTEQQNQLTEQQNQLTEQQNQLTEQQNQLTVMVKVLKDLGMSIEDIAAKTNLPAAVIEKMI